LPLSATVCWKRTASTPFEERREASPCLSKSPTTVGLDAVFSQVMLFQKMMASSIDSEELLWLLNALGLDWVK
jgi:hypothetical protein